MLQFWVGRIEVKRSEPVLKKYCSCFITNDPNLKAHFISSQS